MKTKLKIIKDYFHTRDDARQYARFYARENKLKFLKLKCLDPHVRRYASREYKLYFRKLR